MNRKQLPHKIMLMASRDGKTWLYTKRIYSRKEEALRTMWALNAISSVTGCKYKAVKYKKAKS